jgi:hypothetical protein
MSQEKDKKQSPSASSTSNSLTHFTTEGNISPKPDAKTQNDVVLLKDLPPKDRELAEALFAAIEDESSENVEKVQQLIEQGARVAVVKTDRFGRLQSIPQGKDYSSLHRFFSTPLNLAIGSKKSQIVRTLLETPAGRNLLKPWFGDTPLHKAVEQGDLSLILAILGTQEGRDSISSNCSADGSTSLHLAFREIEDPEKRLAVVSAFIKTTEGRAAIKQKDNHFQTPLHCAVGLGDSAIVQMFLETEEGRAAINQQDLNGETPFYRLLFKFLLGSLLPTSALFSCRGVPPFYDAEPRKRDSPISVVVSTTEKYLDIGVELLLKGADVERAIYQIRVMSQFSLEDLRSFISILNRVQFKKAAKWVAHINEASTAEVSLSSKRKTVYTVEESTPGAISKTFIKEGLSFHESTRGMFYLPGGGLIGKGTISIMERDTGYVYVAEDFCLQEASKILQRWRQDEERPSDGYPALVVGMLAMLTFVTKRYEAVLAVSSQIKPVTKHHTSSNISTSIHLNASNHTTLSSSQNQQTDTLKAQTQQLSDKISAGNTTALKEILTEKPFEQQPEALQQYLQTQAVWAVLDAKTTPTQKSEQLALLAEAPNISLLVENEQHQLPIDVALQQAAEGRIDSATVAKLQEATQQQLEKANEAVFDAIEKYAESALEREEKKSSASISRSSSDAVDDEKPITPQQLAGFVKDYRQNKAELKKSFLASSSSTSVTTSSTPPAISTISLSRMPARKMSAQQRKQLKDLFKRLVHQVISERFIKAVGIGQGWVEEVFSNKTSVGKTVATGLGGAALSIILPGLGGIIASGASAGTEKAYRERQKVLCRRYTLGITSIEQLGLISNSLGRHLLYRYQDFLLQQNLLLSPEVMKAFVDCLITRMFAYLQSIDNPDEIRALLGEKLVDLNKPHKVKQSAGSHTKLTPAIAEQIAENLAAGTSRLDLGLLDKLTTRGTDALLCCDTLDKGKRELRVSKICNSPAVALTATAEQESQQGGVSPLDLVYEGRYSQNLPNTTWVPGDCGVVCISRDEAELRHWNATEKWDGNLEIPQPQPEVIRLRAKVKELEQQVATAQARLSELEPEAERAETKAAMPTPPKTPLAPPKLPSRPPQPRTKPGMFGGRTPPTGQTPDAVSFGSGQPTGDAADVRTSPDNPSGQPTILQ